MSKVWMVLFKFINGVKLLLNMGRGFNIWGVLGVVLLSCSLIFSGCKKKGEEKQTSYLVREEFEQARGGKLYGGIFRVAEDFIPENLFPHSIVHVAEWRIASQIFEGLFRLDPHTLEPEPALITRYEVDTAKKLYRFYLRNDVYFHPSVEVFGEDSTRRLTAEDVYFSLKLLCTSHLNNHLYASFGSGVIKGCDELYKGGADELKGVRVVNDSVVELEVESHIFLVPYILASPAGYIIPKEAVVDTADSKGNRVIYLRHYVGTGPFMLLYSDTDSLILVRNPMYYREDEFGNSLPFLQAISIVRIPDVNSRVERFLAGGLHMLYGLPTDLIINVIEAGARDTIEYTQLLTPELTVQMLLFNMKDEVVSKPEVRKALSWLIPREAIVEFVLQGAAHSPGFYGVVPPAFEGYPVDDVNGYRYQPQKALSLLRSAGVTDLKITLTVNTDNPIYIAVARLIKDTLARYGIELIIDSVPGSKLVEKLKNGQFQIARVGWVADFPHPSNFLSLFYSKFVPYPNFARYRNEEFDRWYERGLEELNREKAYAYFVKAENVLMEDAPVIILWYGENYRLQQPYVKDFPKNAMELRDWTETYFDYELMQKVKSKQIATGQKEV